MRKSIRDKKKIKNDQSTYLERCDAAVYEKALFAGFMCDVVLILKQLTISHIFTKAKVFFGFKILFVFIISISH